MIKNCKLKPQDFATAQKIEAAMLRARYERAQAMAEATTKFRDALAVTTGSAALAGARRAKVWGSVFRLMNPRQRNLTRPAVYADC